MSMLILSIANNVAFKESLKKLEEGTETMENHLRLKALKEKEDAEWEKACKLWLQILLDKRFQICYSINDDGEKVLSLWGQPEANPAGKNENPEQTEGKSLRLRGEE